ncbi:MAG TPA: GNAT family protein [Verrucomicrobiae bacterium]|nr:GNAT family protein [Verrucomicrobiae bacterium]
MTTIEELLPEHFERVAKWLSRNQINRWLTGEWRNRETNPTMLAIATRNRKNRLFLVRFEGEPCGLVGLAEIDPADRMAMVWYLLGEEHLGRRGITSDALRQLAAIAFSKIEVASLYAWIMEDNIASRRVLEKSGFREAGRLRNAASSNGKQVDRVYFDLIPAPNAS